jgi:pyruvate dehydrogenase E2 component (dihydrolipoamide acetyltransferase)
MPFTFTMPKLSPTMEEGTVAKWHKKEGERVEAGDLLLEIATDKATVEHQALDEGWLKKILVNEGETATVNQPIAIFAAEQSESIESYKPEGISHDTTANKSDEKEEEKEKPKKIEPSSTAPALSQPAFIPEPPLKDVTSIKKSEDKLRISPLARKLAKNRGLDITTVKGTGPGGRITSKDLEKAQPAGIVTFGREEIPTIPSGAYDEIPLSPVRKVISRRLQESKTFIPHFYVKQVIDAEQLIQLREQLKAFNLSVSFNDIVIRACALALREHPEVNTGFNSVNQTIVQFKTIDISIAVAAQEGLITPILRQADFKNLGQISVEMRALIEKAREMKLKEHEYKGGSFCVSNLGMFGITEFTAVINPPQSAILAVGGIEESAVVKEGNVKAGKTMVLNLSADHRVIDGAIAAKFLKTVQKLLENPVALTL